MRVPTSKILFYSIQIISLCETSGLTIVYNCRCITTNNVLKKSRVSSDAYLKIGVPSQWTPLSFLSKNNSMQVVKGENVSLECSVSDESIPVWFVLGKGTTDLFLVNM